MPARKLIEIILTILIGLTIGCHSVVHAHVPESLRHDIEDADQVFEKRCTRCHSLNTALSSRAYRDWLAGISERHEKGYDWIPDEEARLAFLHLIVHLEPHVKATVEAGTLKPKVNWEILICLISGFLTISLLATTLIFGHSKSLRRKWFKGHSYFAITTLISAIIHAGYCSYLFILK
jgi:hypothetical protein